MLRIKSKFKKKRKKFNFINDEIFKMVKKHPLISRPPPPRTSNSPTLPPPQKKPISGFLVLFLK